MFFSIWRTRGKEKICRKLRTSSEKFQTWNSLIQTDSFPEIPGPIAASEQRFFLGFSLHFSHFLDQKITKEKRLLRSFTSTLSMPRANFPLKIHFFLVFHWKFPLSGFTGVSCLKVWSFLHQPLPDHLIKSSGLGRKRSFSFWWFAFRSFCFIRFTHFRFLLLPWPFPLCFTVLHFQKFLYFVWFFPPSHYYCFLP